MYFLLAKCSQREGAILYVASLAVVEVLEPEGLQITIEEGEVVFAAGTIGAVFPAVISGSRLDSGDDMLSAPKHLREGVHGVECWIQRLPHSVCTWVDHTRLGCALATGSTTRQLPNR